MSGKKNNINLQFQRTKENQTGNNIFKIQKLIIEMTQINFCYSSLIMKAEKKILMLHRIIASIIVLKNYFSFETTNLSSVLIQ